IWEQVPFSELDVAVPLANLASLYRDQGKFAEAELLYQRTLSIWEQAHGPGHPSVAYALANLITLYAQQGKFAEVEPLSQRAASVWEQAREHPLVADSLNILDVSKMSHFGSLFLTIEKYSQLVLLHPQTVNSLASFSTQQDTLAAAEPLSGQNLSLRE